MSEAEYAHLEGAADRAGVKLSDYARGRLFNKRTHDHSAAYELERQLEGLETAIDTARRVLGEAPKRRSKHGNSN